MTKRIVISLALSALAMPAMADCRDPTTQTEMNRCAALALSKADDELNSTYSKLIRQLDKSQQAEVKSIQLLWIRFKDQSCKYEASGAEGGSLQPLLRDTCLTRLTEDRTRDLKDWVKTAGQ
ncbi:lysozyme inhibitor LprI family protein [Quisquiliibacterium transsilvanicum]|jgi:uncharacterized protein YecT (DUF1311 family)|uniref:Uncharacterized protein YecT (DUF1311 family) n=1 Tax=Quisquiliibacterium transsilvanicum TaxID=1549638 RepID=A0A7W8HL05_9BURK|nr:lysozyme inhibitor LprI family protein [Quisquiliibacterium transsilvanicum]MBB5273802.1 uncharacterized protein YecT (DUF1311 family) [Quisquiliibacterium transsilvanicum]